MHITIMIIEKEVIDSGGRIGGVGKRYGGGARRRKGKENVV